MQYIRTRMSSLNTPGDVREESVRPNSINIPAQTFNATVVFANHPTETPPTRAVSNGAINKTTSIQRHSPATVTVVHDYEPRQTKKELPKLPDYSEIPSPSDSYHSVLSEKHDSKGQSGVTNRGYVGSHHNLNGPNNGAPTRTIREQYWQWEWFFAHWTMREKIFLLVIVILSLIITGLLATLGMVVDRSEALRKKLDESNDALMFG